MMSEYALYEGDEFIMIGTLEEIAKERGVHVKTVKFYLTPTYKKRLERAKNPEKCIVLVDLESDLDE